MSNEKFTFFWSGPFSQWRACFFTVDGEEYNCTEQYMMAQKALMFGDQESYKKIMDTSSPDKQKAFGRRVANFDKPTWDAKARDIVYRANYAKFTQNPALREELMATAGTTLVEASPFDTIWGIGLGEHNPDIYDRSKWQGTNWLGEVLTKLREDLLVVPEA